MKKYETVVVFDPNLGEAQLNDEVKKVRALIESKGGENVDFTNWGKKKIAYQVKKFNFGYFIAFTFTSAKCSTINDINSILRITESVIKFLPYKIELPQRKFKGNIRRSSKVAEEESFDDELGIDA
jgi:small subunit ribosomal protein S6